MKRKPSSYSDRRKVAVGKGKDLLCDKSAPPLQINVRTAKNQLSSLLERATRGDVVVITSDGKPKAKLVPYASRRKSFRVDWQLLKATAAKSGAKPAEKIVREDRDGRP